MNFDIKWIFELLKLKTWQLFAIAAASAVLLYLNYAKVTPDFDTWLVLACFIGLVISGFLWLAAVLALAAEWTKQKLTDRSATKKKQKALAYALSTLNGDENDFLKDLVEKGQTTYHLNPFNTGRIATFVHLGNICSGLESKDIVSTKAADSQGKAITVTIKPEAWPLLKEKFKS